MNLTNLPSFKHPLERNLLAGLLAAGWLWGLVRLTSTGMPGQSPLDGEIHLVEGIKLMLATGFGILFLFPQIGDFGSRLKNWCLARPGPVLGILGMAWTVLSLAFVTPRINFGTWTAGPGYGYDGAAYGWMAEHFAWFTLEGPPVFSYRILAPLLVHVSRLPTLTGFTLLNFLSFAGASFFLARLLRHYRISPGKTVLALLFFAAMKFGLKFWIYHPVTTDGLGTLLLLATLDFSVRGQAWPAALSLCLAVFTRENLLALIPFALITLWKSPANKMRGAKSGILVLPVLVFAASRKWPVIAPTVEVSLFQTASYWLAEAFRNPVRAADLPLAYLNSLGVLIFAFVFSFRSLSGFLKSRPEWIYYAAVTLVLSLIGGSDIDRFAFWQAPFLILILFAADADRPFLSRRFLSGLFFLHLVAMETLIVWFPDAWFYCSRFAVCPDTVFKLNLVIFYFFAFLAFLALREGKVGREKWEVGSRK